jgi:iron complex outermembrane receptor protein
MFKFGMEKNVIDRAKSTFLMIGVLVAVVPSAWADTFNISAGDLATALDAYVAQTGVQLILSENAVKGARTHGVKGNLSRDEALTELLDGTGFTTHRENGAIGIIRRAHQVELINDEVAAVTTSPTSASALETVTVTSSKIGGDVQNIPIAITALSQEQLTATQTAGGPDLIKQVPNMTFTKTNFSGYSIQIRGIGTQAISVTTDPAVAVAFNDIPFIRNHFFEQEFYDVAQVEVLRGPQGTLYGRNATAGVVNLVSAKPSDQFEAMGSVDVGNYQNRRLEAMINIPVVDDYFDVRIAGEWTKRQGYSFNETDDNRIDGRDLWSGRMTLGWKPTEGLQTYLIWEHFSEDDDRIRSSKQLCKTDYGPGFVPAPPGSNITGTDYVGGVAKPIGGGFYGDPGDSFIQGCVPASLYSPDSFQAPLSFALPYVLGAGDLSLEQGDPYSNVTQSRNLRVVESGLDPTYKAKNDVVEFNADYAVTPALTFTSQTGFGHDFLYSTEDYNRFGSNPGVFVYRGSFNGGLQDIDGAVPDPNIPGAAIFCDPQLGCSDRVILEDLSDEHAWQLSQEFRLASNFSGPFNFSIGGNYLHYETEENYYVFGNILTLIAGGFYPGLSDSNSYFALPRGFEFNNLTNSTNISHAYIDPNPLSSLNNNGHNYFLSQNPYVLNSYAAFGETNYNIFSDLKLTTGLRWTDDQKHFSDIPSWLVEEGWGYPIAGVVNQQWDQFTGRAVANWTPKLDFTDQTLIYGSYSHGYKAGGANPPGAIYPASVACANGSDGACSLDPIHPLTFKPEFVDAFEIGTKNTLLDGALSLNGDTFYYNYENYQVSEIVDRTAINQNFDAHAEGAELEATWEPLPGLRFNFAGGWEDTALAKGDQAVDLMDRTAGHPGWFVMKPFVTESSNCIFPTYVAENLSSGSPVIGANAQSYCSFAYFSLDDPLTGLPYKANPTVARPVFGFPAGYPGFDPLAGTSGDPYTGQNTYNGVDYGPTPNDGAGFSKNLGGNKLPNAPPYTVSFGAQYTIPLTPDWAGTLRSDFYWQDASWWRVFNDLSYDRLRGYDTVNLTLILTSQSGWQVMLYDKNVFNTTAITGAFLNSDDTGLTTNVFLTDPKLIGIRVTKNW